MTLVQGLVLQIHWDSQKAWTLANLIVKDSQMVDYWALHLQMETQKGWRMVYQIHWDSQKAWTWANLILTDSQTAEKE